MHGKGLAIALSVVLVCALCPAPALGAPLEAGGSPELATQASKTAYVLTKVKVEGESYQSHLLAGKFTYNTPSYLLKKVSPSNSMPISFSYSGTKLNRMKQGKDTLAITTTKAGAMKKAVWTSAISASVGSVTTTFDYASNRKAGFTQTMVALIGDGYTDRHTFTHGSNGHIAKQRVTGRYTDANMQHANQTTTYKYDAKGNLTKLSDKAKYGGYTSKSSVTYANKYDSNGNLKKRTVKYSDGSEATFTYTYKKVKVSKAVAPKVKTQQWALVNANLNYALGVSSSLMY